MTKINQKYIADKLDISITTVSRCFTNHPKINPETRASVLNLAAELGYSYSPFRNQKKLAHGQNGTIGVLVGAPESLSDAANVAAQIFMGISQKAATLNYAVELFHVDPSSFDPNMKSRRIIPNSRDNNYAGIVLIFPFKESTVDSLSQRFNITSVLDNYEEMEIDSINPDEGRGVAKMMRHLKNQGHEKIGFYSWNYKRVDTPWVETRLGSYFEHLYRFDLPFEQSRIIRVNEDLTKDSKHTVELIKQQMEQGMTALMCAADHQAYELIRNLSEAGIRVPEDLSITGYDGIPVPVGMKQVTTYSSNFHEIGMAGMISIKRRIDRPLASRAHMLVDGEMIVGETTQTVESAGVSQ